MGRVCLLCGARQRLFHNGRSVEEMKNNTWFFTAVGALFISIMSLFTSVITYQSPGSGSISKYSILDLFDGEGFVYDVLAYYEGDVLWRIDTGAVRFLAFLALTSLIVSLFGICTMRTQHPRRWQFVMTVAGLIGTSIPSLLLFFAVSQSQKGFVGTIRCGIAPVIMPIAALISIVAVTYRKNSTEREFREAKARNLIREAGDLDMDETPYRKEKDREGHKKGQGSLYRS